MGWFKQKREYLDKKGVRCLHCGTNLIESGPPQMDTDVRYIKMLVRCTVCDRSWTDIYILTDVMADE